MLKAVKLCDGHNISVFCELVMHRILEYFYDMLALVVFHRDQIYYADQ